MCSLGAPQRLTRVFQALFESFRGGMAIATVVVGAFFTAFTGASGVTILALGGLLMPLLVALAAWWDVYRKRADAGDPPPFDGRELKRALGGKMGTGAAGGRRLGRAAAPGAERGVLANTYLPWLSTGLLGFVR